MASHKFPASAFIKGRGIAFLNEGILMRSPGRRIGFAPPEEACAIARAHKRRSAQKAQEENGSSVA